MNIEIPDLSLYCCPECKSELISAGDNQIKCIHCNEHWDVLQGIPVFSKGGYRYNKDLKQQQLMNFIEDARHKDWEWVENNFSLGHPSLKGKIFAESRADWYILGNFTRESTVLDFGCGYGTMTMPISKMVKSVFAIEADFEQAAFVNMRKKLQQCGNVEVLNTDSESLPFREKMFDCIFMIGVLEWVAVTNSEKTPSDIQSAVLKKLFPLLKDNGILIIGIENRLGWKYFLGRRDEHSGLLFSNLLPRKIANYYSQWRRKRHYRTYTYTRSGYMKLLKNTGFKSARFFMPLPFYHYPDYLVPLSKNYAHVLQYLIENVKISPLVKKLKYVPWSKLFFGISKYFANSYFIVAQKSLSYVSLAEHIARQLEIRQHSFTFLKINSRKGRNSKMILLIFENRSKYPLYVVKIDRPSSVSAFGDCELRTIKMLKNSLPAKLSESIPRIVHTGTACNLQYYVQEYVNGTTLCYKMNSRNFPNFHEYLKYFNHDITRVFEWLIQFHDMTKSSTIKVDDEIIENAFISALEKAINYLNMGKEGVDILNEYRSKLGQLKNSEIPQVRSHGDFGISNIIVNNNTYSIIDWELSQEKDFPFYDVLNLFYTYFYSDSNDLSLIRERHNGFSCANESFIMGSCCRRYAKHFRISLTDFDFYIPVFYSRKALNDYSLGIDRKEIWRFLITTYFSQGESI